MINFTTFIRAPTEIEYLMRNVKLDPPEKHNLYVKSLKANKFESIQLPEGLPPIPSKPQVPEIYKIFMLF